MIYRELTYAENGVGGVPTWIPLFPLGTPPAAREGHVAIYDSANNRMIIFGGGNNGIMDVPNDLWALTNANGMGGTSQWIQLAEAGQTPAAVENFASFYDAANNRMTIFGGCCYWNNNTWLLTNANGINGTPTWTQLQPAGTIPQIREVHAFGYDPALNEGFVFGLGAAGINYTDVWGLSSANDLGGIPTWTNLIPNGQPGSPPLPSVGLDPGVYDPFSGRLMLEDAQTNAQGGITITPWVLATTSPSPGGTITVTTNLPAATFAITGPAAYSGNGTLFTQTSAPSGTYTVTYGAVTGYLTPPSQTGNLSAGGGLSFS